MLWDAVFIYGGNLQQIHDSFVHVGELSQRDSATYQTRKVQDNTLHLFTINIPYFNQEIIDYQSFIEYHRMTYHSSTSILLP
jgi:hypothetical protein